MTSISTTLPTAPPRELSRLPLRPTQLVAGLGVTALAVGLAVAWGTGVSSVLLFALLPDVAFLLAIGQPMRRGQLPARAVPAYNLLHHPVVPTGLLALAATGAIGHYWVVAALAWGAHILIDRGFGYGLRTRDGWQRG